MPITFYGKWSLKVVAVNGTYQERVRITGSQASDGAVAGIVGDSVAAIDGSAWEAYMEWTSDGGTDWGPNLIVARMPGVTSSDGLIVTLYASVLFRGPLKPVLNPEDFNLVVQFNYLNREVNPCGTKPYCYTLPPGSFRPKPPARCRCECICTCRPVKRSKDCKC